MTCARYLVLGVLTFTPAAGLAQSTGATLQGRVSDPQGGVLPGATVVITNVETGLSRTAVTDERGWYRAPALPPGRYELRTELQGFVTHIRTGLTLTIGQEATINVTLSLASVQETVTVTGETRWSRRPGMRQTSPKANIVTDEASFSAWP